MSLVNEVQNQSSKNWIKNSIIAIIITGIGYVTYGYFFDNHQEMASIEKKSYTVSTGTLKNSIESDGRVVLKDELHLDFVNPGIIKSISKKEGDTVKKGDIIAMLDTQYLDITVDKSKIALKTAEANYNLKKRGGTPDEIRISEQQLVSSNASYNATLSQVEMDIQVSEDTYKIARDALENTKKQTEINKLNAENTIETINLDLHTAENTLTTVTLQEEDKYKNSESRLIMEAGQLISSIEKNLYDIDVLLGVSDKNKTMNDSYEAYLGWKNYQIKTQADMSYREAQAAFDIFYTDWKNFRKNNDTSKLIPLADQLQNVSSLTNKALTYTTDTLRNSITSTNFSQTILDSYISSFENALANLKNESTSFATVFQTTGENKISMEIKIQAGKDTIATQQQKLKIAETSLRKTVLENEIAISQAKQKLDQAKIGLNNASVKKDTSLEKEQSQIEISKSTLSAKKGSDVLELEPLYMLIVSAKKNLEEAEKKGEDAYLRSPIDGKIAKITGNVGETTSSLKEAFVTTINLQI